MALLSSLKLPESSTTVKVRIIDTTSRLTIPTAPFFSPSIPGHTHFRDCPSYSFLVEHHTGQRVLFDLGVRKDKENMAPRNLQIIKHFGVNVDKGVREILEEHGVDGSSINAIIWSHQHWDHIGSVATFDSSTALLVGPGFKEAYTPGYPTNPDSALLDSDMEGRPFSEVAFDSDLMIGQFRAHDFFGDGSFYLLDAPGHSVGHLSAIARVTSSPDSFILMGADAAHHGGSLRPSQYHPLPSEIRPNPFNLQDVHPCPGELFQNLLRDGDKEKSFYTLTLDENGNNPVANDRVEAERTIEKLKETDSAENVLIIIAHDDSLLPLLDFFPNYANDFMKKDLVKKGRWAFLKDFESAVKLHADHK